MNESWDGEEIVAKASPKSSQGGFLSRLVGWRHYNIAFGLVMPVVCFGLEFVLLPALGWLPGLIFFHRYRLEGNDQTSRAAVERLRPYRWVADFDPLRRAYDREKDQGRRKRFEQDYSTLTGRSVREGPDRFMEYDGPARLIED
jgi:hypothetical protein